MVNSVKKYQYNHYDAAFTAKIDAWQPLEGGFLEAFGREGLDAVNGRERGFCAERRKIVLLTFENRFAPLGGLAAVMRLLPAHLKRFGEDVIVMTPLYTNIPGVKKALESGALELVIPEQEFYLPIDAGGPGVVGGQESSSGQTPYEGALCCYRNTDAAIDAYYIGIEGRFTAAVNPYSYSDGNDLLDDSLAFCAAVPFVLKKLGFDRDILLHAQDWEAAPVALTSKFAVLNGVLSSARTVLTLHNSFDSGISADRKRRFFGGGVRGDTVLQCSLPLLNGPLTTVSTPFASELRDDALQRTVFTNHLQDAFAANPPVGIENGMFGRPYLRYTYTALSRARQGDFSKLLEQKARFRERMLEVVGAMRHPGIIGRLKEADACTGGPAKGVDIGRTGIVDEWSSIIGGPRRCVDDGQSSVVNGSSGAVCGVSNGERPPAAGNPPNGANGVGAGQPGAAKKQKDRPIFFMSGRLDLMQKGFDVIFRAIESFPAGRVGLIFCPSSADAAGNSREIAFFREIAESRPGDIAVWPFRISAEDYVSVVLGSSFLLMPSFYEPFGAATEGFMHGTPVIARATGGLLVQVNAESEETATGILYRERECGGGWKEILDAPVGERVRVPLYRSMVSEASAALNRAVDVFADRQAYGRMALNGMESLRSFSWDVAVQKYRRVYDAASRRGFFDD